MTTINSIADQIASPTLSKKAIKDGLRVLGFRASVDGIKRILSVSSTLDKHFQNFEAIFPGAKKILGDFRNSKDILALLDSAVEFPTSVTIRSNYIAAPFCTAIGHKDFRPIDFNQYPILAELIAFFWLIHSSIHTHPHVVVPDKLAKLLYTSIDFARDVSFAVEDHPELVRQSQASLDAGLAEWIDMSSSTFEMCASNPPTIKDIREGFSEAFVLLNHLSSLRLVPYHPPQDFEHDVLTPAKIQRGSTLDERERLNIHHNAFQEADMQSLAKSILSIIEFDESNNARITIGATPQYFFEALIVAIALATGRTISGAIKFQLNSESNEHINIKLFSGYSGKFYYPIWERTVSSGTKLKLPLPEFLRCLTRETIRFDAARTIEDCLPYSLDTWEDRCFYWLDKQTSVSRHKLNRRIRDTLARTIYQESANTALLNWITTPIQNSNRQPESLSHYLSPLSERTVEAYAEACRKIFNKYGASKQIQNSFIKRADGVTTVEQRLIALSFLNNMLKAKDSGDYIEYHNSLARYILMMLIVATGHRKSNAAFFFPWDILTSEHLVFISDKQTVGSEARFIPIPEWLSDLVKNYRLHLHVIADRITAANPQLANRINQLLNKNELSSHPRHKPADNPSSSSRAILGQFFLIDKDLTARTITTRDLEKFYIQTSTKGIRLFRKSVANSLWFQGLSGYQIEAFLGHNGEQHAFGESSAWSITQWADQVREAQEHYLSDNGWKSVEINSTAKSTAAVNISPPCFEKSVESYEGRSLANDAARANARMIIRDLLPPEWFSSENSRITDDDVIKLKEAAQERLSDDPQSCMKINQAIAKEISVVRQHLGRRVSSTLENLTRTEPGPISIASSRHFAIASEIREWWISRLGSFSNDASENYIDRLTAIGLSLIVFDAVLDKSTWAALLSSVANHETRSAHGCLLVRAQIEKPSRIFDKSLIFSPYTAAQIVGFELKHGSIEPDQLTIKNVIKRIVKWLKSAPHTGDVLSVEQLIAVFKAWWLLRLPGTEFAIVTGNYSGPAPDIISESALYGIQCKDAVASTLAVDIQNILTDTKRDRSFAKSRMSTFLSHAAGSFELKEQTSRRQRNQLLRLLQDTNEHAELKALANQKPIISTMLGFLQYMLDEGGKRVEIYRFGSIKTYFSHVSSLVDIWWDSNLEDLESSDYDEAYTTIIKASNQSSFPIWLFHKFMRETYDAPHSSVTTSYKRTAMRCRSAMVTIGQFEKAWNEISQHKDGGQLAHHTKTFLGISYQYGLRTKEALGLELSHVLLTKPLAIRIEKNNIRDLKTKKKSLRITQPLLAITKYQKYLLGVMELCRNSPVSNDSLFADTENRNSLYSKSRINQATTFVLRSSTGNLSVVPYSMRHSAATRLAHFAFNSHRKIPISSFVENALKGEIDTESITSCFTQGFNAWPFWPDRVAMFLGHTSVDTLLNTYWHSSHIRLAEQTWHSSENIALTNYQIASMLGKDRTSINKQLSRLRKTGVNEATPINEALIVHYIENSKIPEIGDDLNCIQPNRKSRKQIEYAVDQDNIGLWTAFHRLLCTRLIDNLTIADTLKLSAQFNLSNKDASAFLSTYENIVRENGFDDFEPRNSHLTIGASKHNSGAIRGSVERERGIAAAQRILNESDTFAAKLETFTALWVERTHPATPWFVARSVNEFILIREVLMQIGVTRAQLEYLSCNFDISTLKGTLTKSEIEEIKEQTYRISSGTAKNARVTELGIRVKQQMGAKIGDYRDTHRLALVLATISRAKIDAHKQIQNFRS